MERRDSHLERSLLKLAGAAFALLGLQVGVWAVPLADLARAADANPPHLGMALTALSAVAVPSVLVGGRLIDRVGRRAGIVVGCGGTGAAVAALGTIHSFVSMVGLFLVYGVLGSLYDVVVNTLGGDYERLTGRVVMPRLHAVFSGAAATGALASAGSLAISIDYRAVYLTSGSLLFVVGMLSAAAPLPPIRTGEGSGSGEAAGTGRQGPLAAFVIPGVALAATLVTLAFFNDGAIEGYSSVYLRATLRTGALVGGVGIAAFHAATMLGRLIADRMINSFGQARVLVGGGLLAASGYIVALVTTTAPLVICGLLVAGLGAAPVVPIAYSLAARRSGSQGGAAASVVTACGYGSFILAPTAVGSLAGVVGLRHALTCLIMSAGLIGLVGHRSRRLVVEDPRVRPRESAGAG